MDRNKREEKLVLKKRDGEKGVGWDIIVGRKFGV